MRDVTAQRRIERDRADAIERERVARAAAEAANRAKDEFLAIVSHELRTPLTAILGWSRLLHGRTHDAARVARAMEVIERNATALARLVSEILDVSRIIAGKLEVELRSIADLQDVVSLTVESFVPAAQAKGVRLDFARCGAPCPVLGDRDRLEQVVSNLLSNAIKFTDAGGAVAVRCAVDGRAVVLTVSDTGRGIEPDFLPHLFNRFQQAESVTSRSQGGLGLGLAIVRHLVELHDGRVSARSDGAGRGTTFNVTLPLLPGPAPPGERGADRADASLGGLDVLVVEDDPDGRAFFVWVLEQRGATVRTAASAAEAVQALAARRPDVLLCDIGLPGEDGYSLMARLRRLPPEEGGATPAAAPTAFVEPRQRDEAIRAGFQVHLAKPIDPDALVTAVFALARRTPRAPGASDGPGS